MLLEHFGSFVFGAFMCPLVWVLIRIDNQLRPGVSKAERNPNAIGKLTLLDTKINSIFRFFHSINRNAYIQIPVYHKSFMESGYLAHDLFHNPKIEGKMNKYL